MTDRVLRPRNKDGTAAVTPVKAKASPITSSPVKQLRVPAESKKYKQPITTKFEFNGPHGAIFTLLGLPFGVYALNMLCDDDGCPPIWFTNFEILKEVIMHTNYLDWHAMAVYVGWLLFHLILAIVAPGETVEGSKLTDGTTLKYKLNGFSSMIASFCLVGYLVTNYGLAPLVWLADNYFQLASAGIIFCTFFSIVLYVCSHRSTNVVVAAGGNSGYPHYDLWMGRELNPRIINRLVDLKFVCELRPGLIGWFILNLGFAAKQYETFDSLSNSMILVIIGQGYYVFDAIWNEKAILTTMDITTDGFGFMLLFGDLVWVPFTYALQGKYLSMFPQHLSLWFAVGVFVLNLFGLWIFRSANSEKNAFRTNPDHPQCSHLKYMPTKRGTKLLVSGWWGMARKINYTGDWLMALSWCLPCGFDSILPYFYAIYFAMLLVHRAMRDDEICHQKYGSDWLEYKKKVPYLFVPGIW